MRGPPSSVFFASSFASSFSVRNTNGVGLGLRMDVGGKQSGFPQTFVARGAFAQLHHIVVAQEGQPPL